jgi:hypothetical protein
MTAINPDARLLFAQSPIRWTPARTIAASAAIVVLVEMAFLLLGDRGVLHGVLFDPDCYMHLQRALRLLQGGWQGGFDPRVNAPFGFDIHWTSLFDGIVAAGGEVLRLSGFSDRMAVFLWGAVVSPLLLIAALAVLAWGVRPWVNGPGFLWMTVLLFTQPELQGAFLLGRVDHHSLVLGLFLAQMAWLYAALDGRTARAPRLIATLAGIGASIQLCTTVEGLLSILMVSLVLAIAWARYRQTVLPLLSCYWAGALGFAAAWLLITRGAQFWLPAYDRVSIVHLLVLAGGLLGIGAMAACARRLPRGPALLIGGGVAAGIVALVYPDFFLGPWPHLEPSVRRFHAATLELQPLLPTSLSQLGLFVTQLTGPILALPLAIHTLRHGRAGERFAMLASLCGFALFGALATAQMRWSGEAQATMLLPWTLTTQRLMQVNWSITLGRMKLPLRSVALAGAILLQLAPAAVSLNAEKIQDAAPLPGCDWSGAIGALGAIRPAGIVMTRMWVGPEILWRTGFRVVGAPYEIAPALSDTDSFESGNIKLMRDVLVHRHVDYVLSCGKLGQAQALRLNAVAFPTSGFDLYRAGN